MRGEGRELSWVVRSCERTKVSGVPVSQYRQ
jgi:hypothetical protein